MNSNEEQQFHPLVGEEPPMYLQRPGSARSQDMSHILAQTFRHLFMRDTVAPNTVRHLQRSKTGEDDYHQRYVESLEKVSMVKF